MPSARTDSEPPHSLHEATHEATPNSERAHTCSPGHDCAALGCVTTLYEYGHFPPVESFISQSSFVHFSVAAANVGPKRFKKLDKCFACLHHYLNVIAKPAEIMISMNTPLCCHPIDDKHGNACYQMISHPNWKQIAPPISLAVQSRTVIFLNKRLSEDYNITIYPDIPDVDILYVTITEKATCSQACHNCRSTTIEIPMAEIYATTTKFASAEYEANSVNKCNCVEFSKAHDNTHVVEVNETRPYSDNGPTPVPIQASKDSPSDSILMSFETSCTTTIEHAIPEENDPPPTTPSIPKDLDDYLLEFFGIQP